MTLKFTGLDKLQRGLADAQRAFNSLNGATVATLKSTPAGRANTDAAIRQMERTIDAKMGRHHGNGLVDVVAKGLKEQCSKEIRKHAAKGHGQHKRP